MTADILEKAEILATAIANSSELNDLRETEKAMLADAHAQQIIAEFQEEQQRLAELQAEGKDLTDKDQKKIDDIEQKVENHPLISAYLQAQDRFTRMLDSVNSILANAIASGPDYGSACSTCGTGYGPDGGCSCGSC